MLVRCNIPEADNIVKVGYSTYHFKKDVAGVLACEVDDAEHLQHLLGKDEFEPYEGVEGVAGEVDDDDDGIFSEVVAPPPGVDPLDNATYEELAAMYQEKFGKAAHPATKHETLLERLRAGE